ncbi:MAG: hypothetical protein R6U40_09745 [Desulfobacterales bacterium]
MDERDVIPEHDVKSIGYELTFSRNIISLNEAQKELLALSNSVARPMRHIKSLLLSLEIVDSKPVLTAICNRSEI